MRKNIKFYLIKIFIFLQLKKSLYNAWACFRNVMLHLISPHTYCSVCSQVMSTPCCSANGLKVAILCFLSTVIKVLLAFLTLALQLCGPDTEKNN